MTDYPECISIAPVYRQKRDDDFYLVDRATFPGKGTEYVRFDIAQAMVADSLVARIKALESLRAALAALEAKL